MRRNIPAIVLALLFITGCGGGGGSTPPPEQSAATPTLSPAAGTYASGPTVSLSDATGGASIYYTTDGSTPTTGSTLYTPSAPIVVSSTATIKAMAAATGYLNSAVATGAYTISPSAVSVVLSTNDQTQLMAVQPGAVFTTSTADAGTNTILVDSTKQYQSMDGFGAAFTDSRPICLWKSSHRRRSLELSTTSSRAMAVASASASCAFPWAHPTSRCRCIRSTICPSAKPIQPWRTFPSPTIRPTSFR
ncbi:MAG: chitobiase/beta-hexosaminidase C-terminal domain-containing protein [Terriglobales bacterium]